MITSALVVATTRPEASSGVEAVAQHIASRLASDWDDADAVRGYVNEVRDVTGFEVRLVGDAKKVPGHVRRVADRGGLLAPAGPDRIFVPVVRGGALLGALEMNRFGVRPAAWSWWRLALTLFAVTAVLSVMAAGSPTCSRARSSSSLTSPIDSAEVTSHSAPTWSRRPGGSRSRCAMSP